MKITPEMFRISDRSTRRYPSLLLEREEYERGDVANIYLQDR